RFLRPRFLIFVIGLLQYMLLLLPIRASSATCYLVVGVSLKPSGRIKVVLVEKELYDFDIFLTYRSQHGGSDIGSNVRYWRRIGVRAAQREKKLHNEIVPTTGSIDHGLRVVAAVPDLQNARNSFLVST